MTCKTTLEIILKDIRAKEADALKNMNVQLEKSFKFEKGTTERMKADAFTSFYGGKAAGLTEVRKNIEQQIIGIEMLEIAEKNQQVA
jgi:hypothetical protein